MAANGGTPPWKACPQPWCGVHMLGQKFIREEDDKCPACGSKLAASDQHDFKVPTFNLLGKHQGDIKKLYGRQNRDYWLAILVPVVLVIMLFSALAGTGVILRGFPGERGEQGERGLRGPAGPKGDPGEAPADVYDVYKVTLRPDPSPDSPPPLPTGVGAPAQSPPEPAASDKPTEPAKERRRSPPPKRKRKSRGFH